MKKFLVLFTGLITFSCSLDEASFIRDYQTPIAIESAQLPDAFVLNETYDITVTYLRQTNCHAFYDIFHKQENNEVNIAVINTVFESNGNCTALGTELEAAFTFKATLMGSYIFKFWKGEQENGEDDYLIVEVPVIE